MNIYSSKRDDQKNKLTNFVNTKQNLLNEDVNFKRTSETKEEK